jgi:hypothetical protein
MFPAHLLFLCTESSAVLPEETPDWEAEACRPRISPILFTLVLPLDRCSYAVAKIRILLLYDVHASRHQFMHDLCSVIVQTFDFNFTCILSAMSNAKATLM